MNISLLGALKFFVDEQLSPLGYGTSSECLRDMIRKDQGCQQLRSLLLAGAASAPTALADVSYFEGLRDWMRKSASPRTMT